MPGAPTLCNIFIYLYFIYLYIQYHTSDLTITTPVAESDSIVKGGERVGWGVVEGGGGGQKNKRTLGAGAGKEGRSPPPDRPLYFYEFLMSI